MDTRIRELLRQIATLDEELRVALRAQESQVHFTLHGRRVEFEHSIRLMHRKLKRSLYHWIITDRPQNFLTGPFIYGMAIPLVLLDLTVTIYQACSFPIYGIAKVKRDAYIVFDRHHLGFLNIVERVHCEYCAYATGLIAYTTEIIARTEQYFCPIKHAHQILGAHSHYAKFIAYGDPTDFHARLEAFRVASGTPPEPGR